VQPATMLDKDAGEVSHSWPQFLPDGHHFLYLARNKNPEKSRIYVQDLGSPQRRALLISKTFASYAKGPSGRSYLLFPRDRSLLAQPLSLSRFELYEEPVAVAEEVSYNTLYGTTAFSVSDNGVLAYRSGTFGASGTPTRRLAWYSRQGQRLASVGEAGTYSQIALSPDETRVAVNRKVKLDDLNDWDIWILELASGIFSRLTLGPSFVDPVWSPDSRKIAAVSWVGNRKELVEITVTSGDTTVLLSDQDDKALETWTPDGRYLLFIARPAAAFQLALLGRSKLQSILNSGFYKGRFKVSPDGRWIAYQSAESGRDEVYVRSFPTLDHKRQVSTEGGTQPLWRKDGKELFYLTLNAKLMAADVKSGPSLTTSSPKLLFQTPIEGNPRLSQYAVTGDGQRFLIMMEAARAGSGIEQFQVELNWFAELKTKDTGRK
jgi:Tol biopolymer transport system component